MGIGRVDGLGRGPRRGQEVALAQAVGSESPGCREGRGPGSGQSVKPVGANDPKPGARLRVAGLIGALWWWRLGVHFPEELEILLDAWGKVLKACTPLPQIAPARRRLLGPLRSVTFVSEG